MQRPATATPIAREAVGLVLALVGTLFLASYMLMVQATSHLLNAEQVLWGNRAAAMLVLIPLGLGMSNDWAWLTSLDAYGVGVLLLGSAGVLTIATIITQTAIRNAGANFVAIFITLRLVGTILGQLTLAPHEHLTAPLAITGVVLIIVVISGFFTFHVWLGYKAAAAAAALVREQEQGQQPQPQPAAVPAGKVPGCALCAAEARAAGLGKAGGASDH